MPFRRGRKIHEQVMSNVGMRSWPIPHRQAMREVVVSEDTYYPRGSEWGVWDLHVHTPSSLVQNYGGDREDVWERFVADIEELPSEYTVLGVNDYLFLDGYRKLRKYKQTGRLENIDLLVPVIELRLKQFGGTRTNLSKVNYHVLFNPDIDPGTIQRQFINRLDVEATLTPAEAGAVKRPDWRSGVNRESIRDFGEAIINSIEDEDVRAMYGSPLMEGFNNVVFSLDDIRDILNTSYFDGQVLTAVGKTEWADIKWSGQAIAEKKTIINHADIVFGAYNSPSRCQDNRGILQKEGVNCKLLDCSDAHDFSDSEEKDKVGNCYTWIKAIPTFSGLQHSIRAYGERVLLGSEPEKLRRVRKKSTEYIKGIDIRKKDESDLDEAWFDVSLEFNPGLVAIIGNKGNGKSALTDIIGLLGNTKSEEFSFLNREKFLKPPKRKAEHFGAQLQWKSGDRVERGLAGTVPDEAVERVRYIPQGLFEDICTEIIEDGESAFEKEIDEVVFSHIPKAERLGSGSLDALIEKYTEDAGSRLESLRGDLNKCNEKIVELETKVSEAYREQLTTRLREKKREIEALDDNKPEVVEAPEERGELGEEIDDLRDKLSGKVEEKEELEDELAEKKELRERYSRVRDRVQRFCDSYRRVVDDLRDVLDDETLPGKDVLNVTVDLLEIQSREEELGERLGELDAELSEEKEDSLAAEVSGLGEQIEAKVGALSDAAQEYQEYQTELEEWRERRQELVGAVGEEGTLRDLEDRVERLSEWPERLKAKRDDREVLVRKIFKQIKRVKDVYRELHQPVHSFIDNNELIEERYELNFEAVIRDRGFSENFLSLVNQGSKGTFYGVAEGQAIVKEYTGETNFDDMESVVCFCKKVEDALRYDKRGDDEEERSIERQLLSHVTKTEVYNEIYGLGYLEPDYELRMGGSAIEHLSPGERGIALLIFYLLVSQDSRPVIIDQPEGNLDSQSIFEFLVPCVKEARRRRQIFLVTHSANLAVVCDAEQIVHARIDKERGNRVCYRSGALESFEFNQVSVDVLEGTAPAFDDRRRKYFSIEP